MTGSQMHPNQFIGEWHQLLAVADATVLDE